MAEGRPTSKGTVGPSGHADDRTKVGAHPGREGGDSPSIWGFCSVCEESEVEDTRVSKRA